MNIVRAKLVAHHTSDGADFVFETVPLGKLYSIDLDSVRKGMIQSKHYLTKRRIYVEREIVNTYSDRLECTGWIVMELIEVLTN